MRKIELDEILKNLYNKFWIGIYVSYYFFGVKQIIHVLYSIYEKLFGKYFVKINYFILMCIGLQHVFTRWLESSSGLEDFLVSYFLVVSYISKEAFIWFIFQIFLFLSIIIPVLIGVAYLTLAERKIIAAMQRRLGPNVIGFWGLFQPLADGLKLVVKQTIVPNKAQRVLFLFAPVYTFALALSAWAVIPFNKNIVLANLDLGVIYLLAVSTLGVYGLIIAGWSSNSKYAFLGALRAAAQMISYDVSIGLILLCLLLSTSTCNLTAIVEFQSSLWFIVVYWPLAIIFFVSILAETNRSPFDLTEAEAELVSGYNVEYSAVGFALFFLAEYSNILMISVYFSLLFLGGWYAPFWLNFWFVPGSFWLGLKTAFMAFVFIWVRATVPRYRYDQLMALGWKVFLPLSLGFFICINCFQLAFINGSGLALSYFDWLQVFKNWLGWCGWILYIIMGFYFVQLFSVLLGVPSFRRFCQVIVLDIYLVVLADKDLIFLQFLMWGFLIYACV